MIRTAFLAFLALLPLAGQNRPSDSSPTVNLPDHKLVPNDLVSVQIIDEPGYSRTVRVGADGTIVMPAPLKSIHVEGLLPREVETEVARQFVAAQVLVHPNVSVAIMDYAVRLVTVVGAVKAAGQFKITNPISLLDALALAGWATTDGGPELVLMRSNTEPARKINIVQLQSDSTLNVMLYGGETISIPDAQKIWVTGNVTKPQPVPVRNPADATVLKVLANVEGLTQYYGKFAYIYRLNVKGGRDEIQVPLKDMMHRKKPDVNLVAEDILLIPDDNGTKRRAILQTIAGLGTSATSAMILYGTR